MVFRFFNYSVYRIRSNGPVQKISPLPNYFFQLLDLPSLLQTLFWFDFSSNESCSFSNRNRNRASNGSIAGNGRFLVWSVFCIVIKIILKAIWCFLFYFFKKGSHANPYMCQINAQGELTRVFIWSSSTIIVTKLQWWYTHTYSLLHILSHIYFCL